ncbi:MAG: 6,7-dimethyl-8-ribityllumazine synthase [Planctomycetota bacterium]|jgi:6,7-dimethyl-8-ribityllumazine synthase
MPELIRAQPRGTGRKMAIVVSRFNEKVTDLLLAGACETLEAHGCSQDMVQSISVPGALELPMACKWLAESGDFDAIIALGAVIRGETSHYEQVCNEAARGIMDISLANSIPISFGILTCENGEQAFSRAGGAKGNKGSDAALAALEMLSLREALGNSASGS